MTTKGSKSKEDISLEFMESTIEKVNTCLSGLYTLQKILIEKKIISKEELISRLQDDRKKPIREKGEQILEEMLRICEINE